MHIMRRAYASKTAVRMRRPVDRREAGPWLLCLAGLLILSLHFPASAGAQVSSTDLSYFPLHVGDIWVYQVSEFNPNPPNWRPTGYVRHEIIGDTVLANGKRYALFNTGKIVRVDSTTGIVYQPSGSPSAPTSCPDSTEREIYNLTIDTAGGYSRCTFRGSALVDTCRIIPLSSRKVALLSIMRPQREWHTSDFLGTDFTLAEGIGICFMGGDMFPNKQYDLTYAKINGVEYLPVELLSFSGTLLEGNVVQLRWKTANEVQNRGFTVQRSVEAGDRAKWIDLAFIPSTVEEGHGDEYTYADRDAAATGSGTAMYYRLRQQDFDGTVSYSPVVEVRLAPAAQSIAISMYPNPAPVGVTVRVVTGAQPDGELQLFNSLGRELLHRTVSGETAISTAGLTPGVYFLTVRDGAGLHAARLVVY